MSAQSNSGSLRRSLSDMIDSKKVVVVLPAYNAGRTLERTVAEIPRDIVDEIILTDDAGNNNSVGVAGQLGFAFYSIESIADTGVTKKPATLGRWRSEPTSR